ncbi:MAG: chloride channel protein [Desulfovibrio sp.]
MFLPGVLRNGGFGLAHWPRHARRLVLSALVGVVAGLGAVFFDSLLVQSLTWLVEVPMAWARHGIAFQSAPGLHTPIVSWIIIPIAGLGGLASGLLVFCIAPEAEGHGTDAMIESFHLRGGYVRKRAPIIKLIASALTIGSGGSAGKEGPIAQIGSGFGSILATFLKLDTADRRILLLAGAAGGIGAIFQAPLGAALFVPGVLYRDTEYEFEALLSCIIASISAYAVFSQVFGRQALFTPGPVHFAMPVELLPCLIFGVLCAAAGYIYIKVFYGLRDHFFKPLPIPRMLKPAVGGLLLGCVAWQFPEVIDGGYVWIQTALDGKMLWQTMAALVLLKMVATSFTIASGGSGGVFGPSVFIGAMLGGAFGELGHALFPNLVVNPGSFVLIGMGGFFSGVAKVPIASVIMASEMCSSYTLLVPLLLVSTITFLLLPHKVTLYEKQMDNRLASPAHIGEFARGILSRMTVGEAIRQRPVSVIAENMPFHALIKAVTNSTESYFPVVDKSGKMTGILSVNDLREVLFDDSLRDLVVAKDVATAQVARVRVGDSLEAAMDIMARLQIDELPVVADDQPDEIEAMLSKQDIIDHYHDCCLI